MRSGADHLDARPHAERVREAGGIVVEPRDRRPFPVRRGFHVVPEAGDGEVAVLVDQRREQSGQRHHRVGDRAAGHSRVHRAVERAELDVGRAEPRNE